MNEAERRRQIRRRKRIIKVWAARAAVLIVAAVLVFAILMGIKALIVNAGSSDEEIEVVEIVSEEVAEAESITAIEEVEEDPAKFQDVQ